MAEIEVITIKQMDELDKLLMTNPSMKKLVHRILSKVLQAARTKTSKDSKSVLRNDPRQAYRAVKRTVYRRILGGAISILAKRRASNTRVEVKKDRKLRPGQRGGNRMVRGEKTKRLDSYFGSDRGFILRFVNAGTKQRLAGLIGKKQKTMSFANRGSISARHWFASSSQRNMEAAAQQFCELIDKEIENINKNG